jgi:8-oxo-dGTP diphosphatase
MRVVTAGVLRNADGALLLVRRGPEESLSGYWEFPGGKVELDESEHECLQRELKEELAIDVAVGEFIAENHYVYEHGEFLLKAFQVRHIRGELALRVHDELAWVNPTELTSYRLAPADIPIAQLLGNKFE